MRRKETNIIKLAGEALKAFEDAKKAEERLRKAKERASKARKRSQRAIRRFMREFRQTTGLSIMQVRRAIGWIAAECDPEIAKATLEGRKEIYKKLIEQAEDWHELMATINEMAYETRKELALKSLAQHEEALEAARMLGYFTSEEVATILRYGEKEED